MTLGKDLKLRINDLKSGTAVSPVEKSLEEI